MDVIVNITKMSDAERRNVPVVAITVCNQVGDAPKLLCQDEVFDPCHFVLGSTSGSSSDSSSPWDRFCFKH